MFFVLKIAQNYLAIIICSTKKFCLNTVSKMFRSEEDKGGLTLRWRKNQKII